jgi:plasmid maintenance system antidote protein VapI
MNKLSQELLQQLFIEQGKTSRQLSREFHISRKLINKWLLEYNMISIKDIDPLVDLP